MFPLSVLVIVMGSSLLIEGAMVLNWYASRAYNFLDEDVLPAVVFPPEIVLIVGCSS